MNPPEHHTRYIVGRIFWLSTMAMLLGAFLLTVGYQSGELLVQIGSSGLSGLVGFLGGKMANTAGQAQSEPRSSEGATGGTA